jgi:hypothetical protein
LFDVLIPGVLSVTAFFGLQAYLNSDAGDIRFQLGIATSVKLTLICCTLYAFVMRPILKAISPRWWTG